MRIHTPILYHFLCLYIRSSGSQPTESDVSVVYHLLVHSYVHSWGSQLLRVIYQHTNSILLDVLVFAKSSTTLLYNNQETGVTHWKVMSPVDETWQACQTSTQARNKRRCSIAHNRVVE